MEEEKAPVVVYEAGQYYDAALMKSLLDSSGIMCVMLDSSSNTTAGNSTTAIAIRLLVPHSQAEQARNIIEEAVKDLQKPAEKDPGEDLP